MLVNPLYSSESEGHPEGEGYCSLTGEADDSLPHRREARTTNRTVFLRLPYHDTKKRAQLQSGYAKKKGSLLRSQILHVDFAAALMDAAFSSRC
ncbi:hypothetical protein [Paenibacillus sp. SN-8-1]|uniref:hypothetical protein n=1 Tax=Paenibacillus sp. SN-8-1 TaxID=3435409 RepID=UPI003D9A8CF3